MADHRIDADVMTTPYDGMVTEAADSNAIPKIIHIEPITRYMAIIIMMLPVINIFA